MTIHLPYRSSDTKDEVFTPDASAAEFFVSLGVRGKRRADAILAQLINDTATHPDYAAACLIEGNAHDYEIQELVLQLNDGTLVHRRWSDLSPAKEEAVEYLMGVDLNLVTELEALRASRFILRDAGPVNEDIGGSAGRYMRIYLAINQDGEWLSCASPLLDHTYESNTVTRVCRALGWRIILN